MSLSMVIISISISYAPASENNGPLTVILPEGSGTKALVRTSNVPPTAICEDGVF